MEEQEEREEVRDVRETNYTTEINELWQEEKEGRGFAVTVAVRFFKRFREREHTKKRRFPATWTIETAAT